MSKITHDQERKIFSRIKELYQGERIRRDIHIHENANDSYGDFYYTEYLVYLRNGVAFSITGEENYDTMDVTACFTQNFGEKKVDSESIEDFLRLLEQI